MGLGPFAGTTGPRLPGRNPANIQLVTLNNLTSGIYLGQDFQDGYPLTTAGMTEI